MQQRKWQFYIVIFALLVASGCAVNPVTGKRQLSTIDQQEETEMGADLFEVVMQAAGGEYIVSEKLSAYVSKVGNRIAAHSTRKDLPYEFKILNNSEPNAWALPGGKIIITRPMLLELKSEGELAAVLAHEIAHTDARHPLSGVERSNLLRKIFAPLDKTLSIFSNRDNSVSGMFDSSLGLLDKRNNRQQELEADRLGMQYLTAAGYHPKEFIKLLRRLAKAEAENGEETANLRAALLRTHPATSQRLAAITAQAESLPQEGHTRPKTYRSAIKVVHDSQSAYAYADEAVELARADELERAAKRINKALKIESRDAQLHLIRGWIRWKQDNYPHAAINFDRAKSRHSSWFWPHYLAGLANEEIDKLSAAKSDFRTSLKIFETSGAQDGLKRVERKTAGR